MPEPKLLDLIAGFIQEIGTSSANILGVLILVCYIVDRIVSLFGSPELRVIHKQFTALNGHLETLIKKVS